jgi:hypothetical protein
MGCNLVLIKLVHANKSFPEAHQIPEALGVCELDKTFTFAMALLSQCGPDVFLISLPLLQNIWGNTFG